LRSVIAVRVDFLQNPDVRRKVSARMDESLWGDVRWLPEQLVGSFITVVKSQHEKHGWQTQPGILWNVDTMTYIGTQHGLRRMLEIATKTWLPSTANEYRTYLAAIVLSIEALGVDFCGWGTAFPAAHAEALTTLQDYFPDNKTRLLDVYSPTWRALGQDARFRSIFGPASAN
jgi:hypothetical protein